MALGWSKAPNNLLNYFVRRIFLDCILNPSDRNMKQSLLVCCLTFSLLINAYGQSLDLARSYYDNGDISGAIRAIETVVYSRDKTNTDAWILMFYIFKKAETTSPYSQFPDDCIARQYEAVRKLMELPDGQDAMEKQFGSEYKYIFNKFYSEFVVFADKSMKNENFNAAFKNFKRALNVYDNIYQVGLDKSSMDTTLIFNTGYSALRAEQYEETAFYFKKLADANMQMAEFSNVYSWLTKYYILEKKDKTLAKTFLLKGLTYFPDDKELNELKLYLEQIGE